MAGACRSPSSVVTLSRGYWPGLQDPQAAQHLQKKKVGAEHVILFTGLNRKSKKTLKLPQNNPTYSLWSTQRDWPLTFGFVLEVEGNKSGFMGSFSMLSRW